MNSSNGMKVEYRSMICPECGKENNYYHKFCYECGKELPKNENCGGLSQTDLSSMPNPIIFNTKNDASYKRGFSKNDRILHIVSAISVAVVAMLCIYIFGSDFIKNKSMGQYSGGPSSAPATPPTALNTSTKTATATPTERPMPISLELTKPVSGNDTTEGDIYTVLLRTNGDRIFVNERQDDAVPDSSGNVSIKLNITQYGKNRYLIKVADSYGQEKECTIIIDRLFPVAALSLAGEQALSSEKDNMTLTGKTVSGAMITVMTELQYQSPVNVDAEGIFSITFDLPVIPGQYTIELKANAYRYREASLSCVVTKLMDEKAYQKAAALCKFEKLIADPEAYKGKVLYLSGTVDALDTADQKKFTLLVNNKKSQRIYVEYTGETKMTKGASRRLYGEYVGTHDGMPHFLARMAFKIAPMN